MYLLKVLLNFFLMFEQTKFDNINVKFIRRGGVFPPATDVKTRCEYRFGSREGKPLPYEIPIMFCFKLTFGRAMLAPTIYLLIIEVFCGAFLQKSDRISSLRKISCTIAACKDDGHFAILVLYDMVEDK